MITVSLVSPSPRPICSHVHTVTGQAFDEVICLKKICKVEQDKWAIAVVCGDVDGAQGIISADGGVDATAEFTFSLEIVDNFISLLAPSSFPDRAMSSSLITLEDCPLGLHLLCTFTFFSLVLRKYTYRSSCFSSLSDI